MARPKKNRIVKQPPLFSGFKPAGVAASSLMETNLSLDEYEATRLTDFLGMGHGEAAGEMDISRPTFTRLIEKARYKIASFLIKGNMLTIGGGNIHFKSNLIKCNNCGHMFNTNWDVEIKQCPRCSSSNLLDMAGSFGHGQCCRNHGKNRRVNNSNNYQQNKIAKEEKMPRGDGTGPDGKGPKTGRGMGRTAGNEMGRGIGTGQGQGRNRDNQNNRGTGTGRGRNN